MKVFTSSFYAPFPPSMANYNLILLIHYRLAWGGPKPWPEKSALTLSPPLVNPPGKHLVHLRGSLWLPSGREVLVQRCRNMDPEAYGVCAAHRLGRSLSPFPIVIAAHAVSPSASALSLERSQPSVWRSQEHLSFRSNVASRQPSLDFKIRA